MHLSGSKTRTSSAHKLNPQRMPSHEEYDGISDSKLSRASETLRPDPRHSRARGTQLRDPPTQHSNRVLASLYKPYSPKGDVRELRCELKASALRAMVTKGNLIRSSITLRADSRGYLCSTSHDLLESKTRTPRRQKLTPRECQNRQYDGMPTLQLPRANGR